MTDSQPAFSTISCDVPVGPRHRTAAVCVPAGPAPVAGWPAVLADRLVLAPVFNDPNDRIALNILAECFPGRTVVGINCVELVWGLGTLHCMTQQQPAAG